MTTKCDRCERLIGILGTTIYGPFSTPHVMKLYAERAAEKLGISPDDLCDAAIAEQNRPVASPETEGG